MSAKGVDYSGTDLEHGASLKLWSGGFPIATYGIIALNVVLYLVSLPMGAEALAESNGIIPSQLTPITFVQSLFLHIDPIHLSINMIFLWLFGRKVERALGPIAFLLFYIGGGLLASFLHVAMVFTFLAPMANTPIIGASGAVSAVLGMYAIWFRGDKFQVGRLALPALWFFFAWLILQIVLGIFQIQMVLSGIEAPSGTFQTGVMHVGYWSHIGGFVFGMAAAWVFASHVEQKGKKINVEVLRREMLLRIAGIIEEFTKADEDNPFGYAELGRVWGLLRDQSKSVSNYMHAIDLYRRESKRADALIVLREAMTIWPRTLLPHDAAFRFACYFETLGAPDEAVRHLEWIADSARGKPEGEMALLKLAQIQLDRLGRPDLAIKNLDKLFTEYPQSKWAELAAELLTRAREASDVQ